MTDWVLTTREVAQLLGKSVAATKVWLHRHGVRQVEQRRYPRRHGRGVDVIGVYDGAVIDAHRRAEANGCATCVRRVTSIDSGRGVSTPPTAATNPAR